MRYIILFMFAVGAMAGAYADGPNERSKKDQKEKKQIQHKEKLKRVVNANPQHAGYPKADVKGDFPSRIDRNTYYIEE